MREKQNKTKPKKKKKKKKKKKHSNSSQQKWCDKANRLTPRRKERTELALW
jgi:hypothetical protein